MRGVATRQADGSSPMRRPVCACGLSRGLGRARHSNLLRGEAESRFDGALAGVIQAAEEDECAETGRECRVLRSKGELLADPWPQELQACSSLFLALSHAPSSPRQAPVKPPGLASGFQRSQRPGAELLALFSGSLARPTSTSMPQLGS
ncbi:hypothetical protein TgHK011_001923 [Trichoderma gracile]|nr:hypothetical protein TgHK011_001923 [Trichoderma gracile]